MTDYPVKDVKGKTIYLSEKTSIVMVLLSILALSFAVYYFYLSYISYTNSLTSFIPLIILGANSLIHGIAYYGFKTKGDLDESSVILPRVDGGEVLVRRVNCFWISIATAAVVIGMAFSLAGIGYGAYILISTPYKTDGLILILWGSGFVVSSLVLLVALNFLRSKIIASPSPAVVKTTTGIYVKIYMRSYPIITFTMIMALISGIILLGIGSYITLTNPEIPFYPPRQYEFVSTGVIFYELMERGTGLLSLIYGVLLLIDTAILNFLKIKGQVFPTKEKH